MGSVLPLENVTLGEDVCQCTAYKSFGPYCEKWGGSNTNPVEWCGLKEGKHSKNCPGATPYSDGYYTTDELVCNKTKSEYVCVNHSTWIRDK